MSSKVGYYYQDSFAPITNSSMSVGCVAILRYKDSIIIEERSTTENISFIGGKLEANENVMDCIKREVFEETNLTGLNFDFFGIFSDPSRIIELGNGKVYRSLSIVFTANVDDISGIKKSSESKNIKVIKIDEIPKDQLCRTHIPIYESLISNSKHIIQ